MDGSGNLFETVLDLTINQLSDDLIVTYLTKKRKEQLNNWNVVNIRANDINLKPLNVKKQIKNPTFQEDPRF